MSRISPVGSGDRPARVPLDLATANGNHPIPIGPVQGQAESLRDS